MALTGMEAVRKQISVTKLADALNITAGAVSQWKDVPAERIGEVARATGLRPEIIRPDIFAPPPKPKKRASPTMERAAS